MEFLLMIGKVYGPVFSSFENLGFEPMPSLKCLYLPELLDLLGFLQKQLYLFF